MARPRIDLDGVALADPEDTSRQALAVFRYRTTAGLVLLMPESAEFLVPWERVAEATLDLAAGEVRVRFAQPWAGEQQWLRGAETVTGRWVDRVEMSAEALGLG